MGLCWPILGLCWPSLRAMWAHLAAMLAHLGAMLPHLGAMLAHLGGYVAPSWGYVGPSCGLCWPMLTHLKPQDPKNGKNGKSTKHRKTRGFLATCGGRRQGRRPLSPTERREPPSAMPRPGGPWPDLSAYARQPARGPTMLAHLVAMLAYVGLMLTHVEPKGEWQKKHCKTQDILMVGGLSWGYVGPS